METLFSCRNCIHNCGQTLNVGPGDGFCLQHGSVIQEPDKTTCKYLHRKDLPMFVVDEGVREHAAEFALSPGLARLDDGKPLPLVRYSEKHCWNIRKFDGITHALAQYYKSKPRWVLIQAFTGGTDGRRLICHGSLIRHYLNHCGTWRSSSRLVLGLMEEIDSTPQFSPRDLVVPESESPAEIEEQARWDAVFVRLSAMQEYAGHAGLEKLMWVTDQLNGGLSELNWDKLQKELQRFRMEWIDEVINHAKDNSGYFPPPDLTPDLDGDDMSY
jgi:hypothetical protein